MKKLFLFMIATCTCALSAWADHTISGQVTDASLAERVITI